MGRRRPLTDADAATIEWLLASREPAIRLLVHRELLGTESPAHEDELVNGRLVRGLLKGQKPDGGFGVNVYAKWTGAHWRLVSLVELGVPAGEPRAVAAAETVLHWLTGASHRSNVPVIAGLARRCGSQEGNALAVCSRLGLASDHRVRLLADSLVEWQWPDGGWNCDRRPEAHRSSFNETLAPTWGLHEYATATGDAAAVRAARRGAELLLEHRLFRRLGDGEPINDEWHALHWPPYWHYDVLQALVVLARMGLATDRRAADGIELLRKRRRADGRWRASARWWKPPPSTRAGEAIDWGWDDSGDRMVTLRALRVLHAASGRVNASGRARRSPRSAPARAGRRAPGATARQG